MPKDKSSQLDFKTDYPEYGVQPPLLSSGEVKWNGFSLEHHLQPKLVVRSGLVTVKNRMKRD
jgi:hypothetical protein